MKRVLTMLALCSLLVAATAMTASAAPARTPSISPMVWYIGD